MTLAAVLMLLAGLSSVLVSQRGRPANAQITHAENTIEILPGDLGFNPETCILNRNGSKVRFYNADTEPRRVVVPLAFDPDPTEEEFLLDTGVLEPGQYAQTAWVMNANQDITYYDFDNRALTGKVEAPLNPNAADNCKPQPPTPTPTNTPTVTPTPIVTPTPTPTQGPAGCERFFASPHGCAVAPNIANDEE